MEISLSDAVFSALFVICVVFTALVILYVLVKFFTVIIQAVESRMVSPEEGKGAQ
jgi:hypothetical protein